MTNTVLIKRSGTANSVPTAGQLSFGELAINYQDGNLFYKNAGGTVTLLTSTQFVSVAGNVTGGNVNATNLSLSGNVLSAITSTSNITTTGNVSGSYFIGNGSALTGIIASAGAAITNGNSNVTVGANGNITVGVTGISNVAVFTPTGVVITSNISASGNITGNYFFGNGSQLTGVTSVNYTAATTPPASPSVLDQWYNTTTGALYEYQDDGTSTYWVDITGPAIANAVPSGSLYGNSNVVSLLATFGSNTVSTTGNITAGNILPAANITYDLGTTTQRWRDLWLSNSTIYMGNASISANATSLVFTNPQGGQTVLAGATASVTGTTVSATGNIDGGNILTGGLISATGNITGNYFLGNGSQLTGLPATYGDSNVSSFLAAFGSNSISTTGNITGGNILGGANVNATTHTGATVSVTGNVTGNYFLGNGSQLTGIDATSIQNGTSNVKVVSSGGDVTVSVGGTGNVAVFNTGGMSVTANVTGGNLITAAAVSAASVSASGNVTASNVIVGNLVFSTDTISSQDGTITIDPAAVGVTGLVIIQGNLQVNGNTTTINSNVVSTNDLTYNLANNAVNSAAANGGGIEVGPIGSPYITWLYNSTAGGWETAQGISATGNITGSYIIGNGSQLTGLPASYGNANVAANLAAFGSNPISTTGNVTAGYFVGDGSLLSSITGANVVGTVANATFATSAGSATTATTAGTVTSNAQANITSVGVLSSLSVTGNITGGNVLGGANVNATTHTGATVSVTGNITGGNISTPGVISATGNATAGNVTTAGTLSASVSVATNGIFVNNTTVAASYTIAAGTNGFSVGPMTVAAEQNVTIASGQRWVIL